MSAQTLLIADAVITADDDERTWHDAGVLIEGTDIVDVGEAARLRVERPDADVIDASGCVILPGWINTHAHLAMNVLRGLTDDVTLEVFLERLVAAEFEVLSAEMVKAGVRAALAESIRAGTTTVLDMYYYPLSAREVAESAGFRLINGYTFLGATDPDGTPFAQLLERAERDCQDVRAAGGTPWLMPHSTYTLSAEQLAQVAVAAERTGARIHTHCAESPGEMALVAQQYDGARPLAVLDRAGLIGPRTVLAHMAQTTVDELELLRASQASIAHCPFSNLKLACGFAPVADLIDAGVRVALGTDGAASGGALDMQQSARLASLLAKGSTRDPQAVPAMQAIVLGTREGARALGRDDLGVVAAGMRADLQVVDVSGWGSQPRHDPSSQVIYGATSQAVRHVLIDGRFVLRDGDLTTIDESAALADLEQSAQRARAVVERLSS